MALLAEELVEEWLNRQGYFTIRGIKLGVHEIDLLAIRPNGNDLERRHIEVQASVRPIGYVSRRPKQVQKRTGKSGTSVKQRTPEELVMGVKEWIEKKYEHPRKEKMRQQLASGEWSRELVVHRIRYPEELEEFRRQGIKIHLLSGIVRDLERGDMIVSAASGSSFADLVLMGDSVSGPR